MDKEAEDQVLMELIQLMSKLNGDKVGKMDGKIEDASMVGQNDQDPEMKLPGDGPSVVPEDDGKEIDIDALTTDQDDEDDLSALGESMMKRKGKIF